MCDARIENILDICNIPAIPQRRGSVRSAVALAVAAVLLGLPMALRAAVIDQLDVHYKFDENAGAATAIDSAGGDNNGTNTGVTTGVAGIVGNAYEFDGTDDNVDVGSAVIPATTSFTLAGWANLDNVAQNGTLISQYLPGQFGRLILYPGRDDSGDQARLFMQLQIVVGGPPAAAGEWRHVALTRTAGTPSDYALYVDGIEVDTGTSSNNVYTGNNTIVGESPGSAFDFDGLIDDVGIWQRSLAEDELAVIAAFGDGNFVGLGQSIDLSSSKLDDILDILTENDQVFAAGHLWGLTTDFPAALAGGSLVLGRHYVGIDGNLYVILEGSPGNFSGVTNDVQPIPEPSSLLLLGLCCCALVRRRRRTGRTDELATPIDKVKVEVPRCRRIARRSMRGIVTGLVALVMVAAASTVQAMPTDFYEETVLGNNPILYWRLGEPSGPTAANLGSYAASGNAAYVTNGGTTFGVTGPLFGSTNTAITLPGDTANYTIFTPSVGFPHPSTALSYEFWINAPNTQGSRGVASFAASGGGGGDNEFLLFTPDSLNVYINASPISTGVDIATGAWHHVVVTWRSSDGQLVVYKDGSIANSLVHQAGAPINTIGALVLGQEQDSVGGGFDANQALLNGTLDEFAVYNSVLTPAQVLLHYDVGVGNILPPPIPEPSTAALLAVGLMAGCARRRRRRDLV